LIENDLVSLNHFNKIFEVLEPIKSTQAQFLFNNQQLPPQFKKLEITEGLIKAYSSLYEIEGNDMSDEDLTLSNSKNGNGKGHIQLFKVTKEALKNDYRMTDMFLDGYSSKDIERVQRSTSKNHNIELSKSDIERIVKDNANKPTIIEDIKEENALHGQFLGKREYLNNDMNNKFEDFNVDRNVQIKREKYPDNLAFNDYRPDIGGYYPNPLTFQLPPESQEATKEQNIFGLQNYGSQFLPFMNVPPVPPQSDKKFQMGPGQAGGYSSSPMMSFGFQPNPYSMMMSNPIMGLMTPEQQQEYLLKMTRFQNDMITSILERKTAEQKVSLSDSQQNKY